MRIPTTKVYRAFPELDHFSDEQCRAFLHALSHERVRTAIRRGMVALATVTTLLLVGRCMWPVCMVLGQGFDKWMSIGLRSAFRDTAGALAWLIVLLSTGAAAFLLVRDALLRRDIARVMRRRGSCVSCGYGLTGLPVLAGGRVICPECGVEVTAYAHHGEIQSDSAGNPRFLPSPAIAGVSRPWLSDKAKRTLRHVLVWTLVSVVMISLVLFGGYEIYIRRQASRAKTMRLAHFDVIEIIRMKQPGFEPGQPNAADCYGAALSALATLSDPALADPELFKTSFDPYAELPTMCRSLESLPQFDATTYERSQRRARVYLGACRRAGIFAKIDDAASLQAGVWNMPSGLFVGIPNKAFMLVWLNAARMKAALESRDEAEWLSAFESNLALSRVFGSQVGHDGNWAAWTADVQTFDSLRQMLESDLPRSWIEGAHAAWQRQDWKLEPKTGFAQGKRIAKDLIAAHFEIASRARWAPIMSSRGPVWKTNYRYGFLDENLRTLDTILDALAAAADAEPVARLPLPPPGTSLELIELYATGWACSSIPYIDAERANRRAIALALALERARAASGRYPPSLDDLVPGLLPHVPVDPWTGKPFVYRVSEDGQSAILYCVGVDGRDNGGMYPADGSPSNYSVLPGKHGSDFLILRRGTPP